ncbi:hypothetical protein RN001_001416 [Aquatica leii]|uniref:Uncharacterized protein n=1 Tax=Aquatica leii TaxID=1421715 RepID=A0AAN7PBJ7_9COLE|nr:hypothetical protein RN001_001416 [Aquatica leii]
MSEYGVRFAKGFCLNKAQAVLENDDDLLQRTDDITIFPPDNDVVTDNDLGEEYVVNLDNLLASQLQAPAEIQVTQYENNNYSSDDEIPLSQQAAY